MVDTRRVVVAIAACIIALAAAASACRSEKTPAVRRDGRRVIFVGLDGADWHHLDPLIADGTMPALASLVRTSASGELKTLHPPLSPLVWTTMMTGVSPLEHRILDFTRFHPTTRVREPITSDERAVPAIWNMASLQGRRVAVLGLWATWPAEAVNGLVVSDRLFLVQNDSVPTSDVVTPLQREGWARAELVAASQEVGLETMREFLPWLDEGRFEAAREAGAGDPVEGLRRILVETRLYRRLGIGAIREIDPDLAVVYFQGTDAIGHLFAPFAPPKQPSVSEADFERYGDVSKRYFAGIDRVIGELAKLAEERDAILVIASDHGFLWSEGRPKMQSAALAPTAGKWHRDRGIYLIWDPRKALSGRERGHGEVGQVCPTLLSLLGLPPAEGSAVQPLADSSLVASATALPAVNYRRDFRRARIATGGAETNPHQGLEQLQALGYLGSGESATALPGSVSTRTAGSFTNEGLLLEQLGRHAEAVRAWEEAMRLEPKSPAPRLNLARALRANDPDRADTLLLECVRLGLPDAAEQVIGRGLDLERAGDVRRAASLLAGACELLPRDAAVATYSARFALGASDCAEARRAAVRAIRSDPRSAVAESLAGTACLCLGDERAARSHFQRSLALEPNQPELRHRLGW